MFFKKLKLLIAAFAVLALISQSVAAAQVSCSMMDSGASQSSKPMQMITMHHSAHTMHDMPDSNEMMADCCGDDLCSMTNCFGAPTASLNLSSITVVLYSGVFNSHYSFSLHSTESISPFRPPISA